MIRQGYIVGLCALLVTCTMGMGRDFLDHEEAAAPSMPQPGAVAMRVDTAYFGPAVVYLKNGERLNGIIVGVDRQQIELYVTGEQGRRNLLHHAVASVQYLRQKESQPPVIAAPVSTVPPALPDAAADAMATRHATATMETLPASAPVPLPMEDVVSAIPEGLYDEELRRVHRIRFVPPIGWSRRVGPSGTSFVSPDGAAMTVIYAPRKVAAEIFAEDVAYLIEQRSGSTSTEGMLAGQVCHVVTQPLGPFSTEATHYLLWHGGQKYTVVYMGASTDLAYQAFQTALRTYDIE